MTTSAVRWPSEARLKEIAELSREALKKLDAEARTPVEIFTGACAELLAGLIYSVDPDERRRIGGLLQAVCREASRMAAKREAA